MSSRRQLLRSIGSLAAIGAACSACYVAAFFLRFAGELPDVSYTVMASTVLIVVGVKVGAAWWFRIHRGWTRNVVFYDLVGLAKAVTCAAVGVTIADAMIVTWATVPRSVVLLDWGITLMVMAGLRSLPRATRDLLWRVAPVEDRVRVLIVGANDAGETLVRAMRGNSTLNYLPVGFIDEKNRRIGERIGGIPVLGGLTELAEIVWQHRVEEVLIVAGQLPGRTVRGLIDEAARSSFRVKVLPSYEQLLGNQIKVEPQPVAIADLLRRPSVEIDASEVRQWIVGKTLLVTGSAGSIGSEICRQLLKLTPTKLVLVDRSETGQFFLERELRDLAPDADIAVVLADLADEDRMRCIFTEHRPQIIFHAAAYKHVPLMEAHVGEALKNIVIATRKLVDLAEEFRAESLVMISTDKAVNPTSVMGSCKRLAEEYVQAKASVSSCRLVTVRFGNVLDSAGSVVPIFREQIARGGPVTVTHPDIVRYFMLIPEAAQLVIQAGAMGRGGEIFVLDMGEPVRIVDMARDMIRLSGLRIGEDIEIRFTGLRPGEKMFEELYGDREDHRPTSHPKVKVCSAAPRKLLQVIYDINRLEESINEPNDNLRNLLQEVVPQHVASDDEVLAAA